MNLIYRKRAVRLSSLNDISKIVLFLSLFLMSVFFSSIPLQLVVLSAIILTATVAGVLRDALPFARYVTYLAVLLAATSVFLAPGGAVLLRFHSFSLTLSPLLFSISMLLRLLNSVLSLNLLLLAVNPDETIAFISRFGRRTAASLLVATRLMPVLTNEGEEILQAFESRGISVRKGRWRDRVRSVSHMIFPMLYSTLDRSLAVAEAMEVRGFPSRWVGKEHAYSIRDIAQISISLVSAGMAVAISLQGSGVADYYTSTALYVNWQIVLLFMLLTYPIVPFMRRWSNNQGKRTDVPLQFD